MKTTNATTKNRLIHFIFYYFRFEIYKTKLTRQELYHSLDYVNHSQEKRKRYSELIISNPELMPHLLDIVFQVDDPISCRAAWVMEFVCKSDLSMLYPQLDYLTENMHKVHLDSAVRPIAKIYEYMTIAYYKNRIPLSRKQITPLYKERMVATGFDWLITEQKVAVKAYTLTTLFWLGTDIDWIHPELHRIMEEDYHKGSAAYKARCRHMFEAIRKFNANKNK